MSRMFQDNLRGDASTVDFEHIFLEDEELSPELLDIVFDGTPDGSKVIETGNSSIDFESLEKDVSSLDEIIQEFFVFGHLLNLLNEVPFCQ